MTKVNEGISLDARGMRVLVTAGAGGIGRAIAERFLLAGARVHVTDIAEATLSICLSEVAGLTGTVGDASDVASVDRLVDEIRTRFGGLDVLVNNVGVAGPTGNVETYSDGDVEKTIGVNLTSHFYFLKRFLPLLKASGHSTSVIEISSVAGRLGYGFRSPYSATKWGIIGLIKSLAIELGPDDIRVNAILPGVVRGARMERVIADRAKTLGISHDEMRNQYLAKISLRRMVGGDDVANLALFLASDLGSNISGQAIGVDGNIEYL